MNNVNDLNKTATPTNGRPTQEPITLSAITPNANENAISINATNGLSGVSEVANDDRPVVRINPAKKRTLHRTIDNPDEIQTVNPDDYIAKPAKAPSITPHDLAINELEQAVQRKQEEYKRFVEYAEDQDQENRERVEAGLENVNSEEVQYLPNGVHVPMSEDEKVTVSGVEYDKSTDDEEEYFDTDGSYEFETPNAHVVYEPVDMFADETTTSPVVEEDDEEELAEEPETEAVEEEKTEDTDKKMSKFFDDSSVNITSNVSENTTASDFASIDDEDFDDVTVASEENLTDEQIRQAYLAGTENLKNEVLEKIINVGKKMNVSQLVVSNKVVSVKDALRNTEDVSKRTAVWPLTYAGRPYKASALRGPEIALLADYDDSGDNGIGITREQARIMFEHDANPYRPATVEAWAKTIPYYDIENVFAAMFVASLHGANYMPMICNKTACQHAYLSDDVDIKDMVKFEKDEAKQRFEEIKAMELTPENTTKYDTVVTVVNDRFAVGLKLPSIFTMLYERATLNQEFIRKHESVVGIMEYVDYIYLIDPDTNQLNPIGWKTYPGDYTKTFKSKIATYAKILKEFDSKDFSVLIAMINSMVNKAADMRGLSYEIPATKCPKCGAEIPSQIITPRSMLFTQQRLVVLATTPTEK